MNSQRRKIRTFLCLVVVLLLVLANFHTSLLAPLSHARQLLGIRTIETLTRSAAGNRTLGFHSIKFINIPTRFDRLDAVRLQAYLSGLDVTEQPAVLPSELNPVGMPPSSNPQDLKPGEKGCWRAHANIWSEIVEKNLPPTLIIESDAAWDIDVRHIMALLNEQFTGLLHQLGSKPIYTHDVKDDRVETDAKKGHQNVQLESVLRENPDDPWHSDHWDILSLGNCFDQQKSPTSYLKYKDPYVPEGKDYFGQILGKERVVHQSGGFVCTTAYAITQRGAAKLLLRTAFDFNMQVDLIIKDMIADGELVAYTTIPTVMAQWHYVDGLGMEDRGANSDIQGTKGEPSTNNGNEGWELPVGSEVDMSGWEKAKKAKSVWMVKPSHPNIAFSRMALQVAWDIIFSGEKDIKQRYP
ncbi:hypothetical protein PSPO01_14495 [Paraphaeosphaeria sporulosa]